MTFAGINYHSIGEARGGNSEPGYLTTLNGRMAIEFSPYSAYFSHRCSTEQS